MLHYCGMEIRRTSEGYLSKPKAADYADVSLRTLDYAVERGELPAFRLVLGGKTGKSRKVLFRKADLDAWIERQGLNSV
jgi:excisionase family DNA binding protein